MKDTQKRDTLLIILVLIGVIVLLYALTLSGSRKNRVIQVQIVEPEASETVGSVETTPVSDYEIYDSADESEIIGAEAVSFGSGITETVIASPASSSAR